MRKLAMNGNDRADSVESNGSNRSGSVSSIFRSTSCPCSDSCANDESSREQLGEVGRVAHTIAELGEEAADLPRDGLSQQLVAPTREVPVDRRPAHPRRLDDVFDRRLAHPEAGDAGVGRLEQAVPHGQRIGGSHAWHVRARSRPKGPQTFKQ